MESYCPCMSYLWHLEIPVASQQKTINVRKSMVWTLGASMCCFTAGPAEELPNSHIGTFPKVPQFRWNPRARAWCFRQSPFWRDFLLHKEVGFIWYLLIDIDWFFLICIDSLHKWLIHWYLLISIDIYCTFTISGLFFPLCMGKLYGLQHGPFLRIFLSSIPCRCCPRIMEFC